MMTIAHPTAADLEMELDRLAARIADGEARIEAARAELVDTTDWEAFWYGLLAQYEAVYRRLETMGTQP